MLGKHIHLEGTRLSAVTQILSWWKGRLFPQRMRSRQRSPHVWQGRRKLRGTTEDVHLTGVPRVSLARRSACEGLFFFFNCCKKNGEQRALEMKENSHVGESGQWMKRLGRRAAWGRTANRLSPHKEHRHLRLPPDSELQVWSLYTVS